MHFACRYGSSHNAVRLVLPRRGCSLPYNRRSFSTSSALLYVHVPNLIPDNLLGSYKPNLVPNRSAQNVAVLGGGITGLATAFNLTKDIPNAKITIFEATDKLGGWVNSERVEVDDGTVLFEWGPRTLRPDWNGNGKATLQLINQLDESLKKSIRGIPFSHPAATNRYIYYPDHLVRMPAPDPQGGMLSAVFGSLRTLLTEPAFKGVISSLFAEPTVAGRARNLRDESVGSFMTRRFGKSITDNLLSALFHGIYAGNIYQLSARTLLPKLWYLESRDADSNGVMLEMMELFFRGHSLKSFDQVRFMNRFMKDDVGNDQSFNFLCHSMRATSVYSFVNGTGQLTDALLDNLKQNANVTIKTNAEVGKLAFDTSNRKWSVTTKSIDETTEKFDYAIHTLSPGKLSAMLTPVNGASAITSALTKGSPASVNVMVVNLYYQNPSLPIPPGFGYLIPRSVPVEENPERALGVIFASETAGPRGEKATQSYLTVGIEKRTTFNIMYDRQALLVKKHKDMEKSGKKPDTEETTEIAELDEKLKGMIPELEQSIDVQLGQDTASGTKLGVMLGGHWWDGWTESDFPSEAEAIEMAKSVIARHLKITEEPMLGKARLQRDCIPQYQVGYRDDMARIHKELVKDFHGRLKVAGPWWQGGVGANDCVKGARETSRRIREAWDEETGLEGYVGKEKWVLVDRRTNNEVMDPLQK